MYLCSFQKKRENRLFCDILQFFRNREHVFILQRIHQNSKNFVSKTSFTKTILFLKLKFLVQDNFEVPSPGHPKTKGNFVPSPRHYCPKTKVFSLRHYCLIKYPLTKFVNHKDLQ